MVLKRKNTRNSFSTALLLLVLWMMMPVWALAQKETVVAGQIVNRTDRTPIAGVNVYFKNSTKAVQSDAEGYFLIRTTENYTTLIFSCVGYKQAHIKLRPGQSIGIEVLMEEENTLLQEVFVIPGTNPAIDLMRKVRMMAHENDVTRKTAYNARMTEQNLVLLSRVNQRLISKRIFDQLRQGNIASADSSLVLPLYMAEKNYQLTTSARKELSSNIFSSPESGVKLLESFLGEMSSDLNFYNTSVSVFGKSIVSPLAGVGNTYYVYYLADSTGAGPEKQYELHFRSKNPKNLAFNGKFMIDSATLALTAIDVELPPQANINYIHNLRISAKYALLPNKYRARESEEITLNMNYTLLADSLHHNPEIFVKRSASYQYPDSVFAAGGNFARSDYSLETLDSKLNDLNNTPLLRTAKWIADVAFTGYMQMGKIDVGNILQIARLTDIEGLRLNLPLRTNERIWKNATIGGYLGYGNKNKAMNYSAMAQIKLPGNKKRVAGISYTDDYRRIDYNYNDFLYREKPVTTGDEDITTTLFSLWSASRLNPRKELCFSFTNDWNSNIESALYLRGNRLYANNVLPMTSNGQAISSLRYQSAIVYTRFSFEEKTYEDHLQRIYIGNNKPVVSFALEAGRYELGDASGNYGKITGAIKQAFPFDFGSLNYAAEAGCILGNVPYPLLHIPSGTEAGGVGLLRMKAPVQTGSGGYSMHQFNMMKYMEYGADKYIDLAGELTLNGLLMNQLPLIKHLNLRELFSLKMSYGLVDSAHRPLVDYPDFFEPMRKPYIEAGVGFTNILRIFSVQSVWRLTDTNKPGVFPWGVRFGFSFSF